VYYLVVECPADKASFSGGMAAELAALLERELIRLLGLVLLRKEDAEKPGGDRGIFR
jgi:hypothetical protein